MCEDTLPLREWTRLNTDRIEKTVTVLVPTEWCVNGEAYCASTALPTEETASLGIHRCAFLVGTAWRRDAPESHRGDHGTDRQLRSERDP